jgi:hypothetical protein
LERRDAMLEKVSDKKVLISRLRLGVTELTAMTWLPDFIEKIRQIYPEYILSRPLKSVGSYLKILLMTSSILLLRLICMMMFD